MVTFPNQKIITIRTDMNKDANKDNPYGCITRKAAKIAAHKLNDGTTAYIMYTHFALCQNDYKFALSPKDIYNELGITKKQYDKAIKKLIQAGYLHQTTKNQFTFYTIPKDITTPQGTISPLASNDYTTPQDTNISTSKGGEIVQYNTDNTFIVDDVSDDIKLYPENEDCSIGYIDSIRQNYYNHYYRQLNAAQWDNQIQGIKIKAILDKYLSTHKESSFYKKIGDKYGRIIKGWNQEKQEPVISYSLFPLVARMMKHDIEDIPQEYYRKN